eukprot:CAMPEP_0115695306 /NCGR_PEP_ID=MMETSP0272-20121206/64697_1 /TAXON_ID=71861 /ORGANISM="Scrippsiella trochoidea, Strain CCMP3099" /LENGTH=298 /DNA_ID=CAMNT_0003135499 /DNA_START=10 /DNA_END=906 /DNA_ORIENTATION=-
MPAVHTWLLHSGTAFAALAAAVSTTDSSAWTSSRVDCSAASPSQCPGEHLLLQRGGELASGHDMDHKHLLTDVPQAHGRLYAKRSLVADEGNGVGEQHGVSLDECGIACDGVPACQSFSYSDFSRACYMKDQEVTMESVPKERRTWDWHLRTYFPIEPNSSLPLPMPVNGSDAVPGHRYIERSLVANEGSGIHSEPHETSAECEKKCDIIGACRSFAYSAEQRMCFLKDAVVTLCLVVQVLRHSGRVFQCNNCVLQEAHSLLSTVRKRAASPNDVALLLTLSRCLMGLRVDPTALVRN